VRFWCAFQIHRPHDKAVIADCRQMLALVEMPHGKVLRLPDEWEKYREAEPAVGRSGLAARRT
jgi:acyl-CoA thioesterase FadM